MTVAADGMRSVKKQKRMTLEEFLTYDDGTDRRFELENGVLVEMGTEATINIRIAFFLIETFLKIVDRDRLGMKVKVEVRSRFVTARDPDFMIHSEESATALEDLKEACLKYGDPNPLIVIEIVSPGPESSDNYQRDYVQRPVEYAERGIGEFWQIDPKRQWVRVLTLKDEAYEFETFKSEETIVSPTFPELRLTAAQVLAAGR